MCQLQNYRLKSSQIYFESIKSSLLPSAMLPICKYWWMSLKSELCNIITHSSQPSLSQKYSPAILQTIVVCQGWEFTKCFQFFDIPNCAILAFKVKIRTVHIIFIIIYSCLGQCCPGLIYLSDMTLGEWPHVQCTPLSAVRRMSHDELQSL